MAQETLHLIAPGLEFLLPYFEREFADMTVTTDDTANADATVAVCMPGRPYPADTEKVAVLVCPNIVGTGMNGLPMEMVERIARMRHFHIQGNEARLSTIHAVDVARAARLALNTPGAHVVTDLVDPTFYDFAEALSYRLGHKRIFTLAPKWARWIMSRRWRDIITTNCIVDGQEFAQRFNFTPNSVTEYLRTHVYDDSSL